MGDEAAALPLFILKLEKGARRSCRATGRGRRTPIAGPLPQSQHAARPSRCARSTAHARHGMRIQI
eukprot:364597-Chlamydomonas_euryale.AAC.16